MIQYMLRRLAQVVLVWLGVALLVVVCLRATGDPIELLLPHNMDPAVVAALKREYGLDRPIYEQYIRVVYNVFCFHLGQSIYYKQPVAKLLMERLPRSLLLAATSVSIACLLGVPLGILSGYMRGTGVDTVISGVAVVIQSVPSFWLGLMLILIFAVRIPWLPTGGSRGLTSLVLPATTLSVIPLARMIRFLSSGVADTLSKDYVTAARAKGVSEAFVLLRHVLRNAARPAITDAAMTFGRLIGGAIVVETVFAWPGIGRLVMDGVTNRDFPVVEGGTILIATLFLLINLVVDLSYPFFDPRIVYD